MTTQNCATMTHSQVCEMNSAQPSRRSLRIPADGAGRAGFARMASSIGTVPVMPTPQIVSDQPGPIAATAMPATAAPLICAAFITSRLSALACCSRSPGASTGSRACEAG